MHKTWLVFRHELITSITRRTYLLLTFGIPLLVIVAFVAISLVRDGSTLGEVNRIGYQEEQEIKVEGYIDRSGLIEEIPSDLKDGLLISFDDEASAKLALADGKISAYYLIPDDYIESGYLYYVYPSVTPLSSEGQDWVMRWTLLVNLLGGDQQYAHKVWHPVDLEVHNLDTSAGYDRFSEEDCSKPGYACESNPIVQTIPLATIVLIYIFIAGGASMLLRNVANEKQNRMIEILITSVDPIQMFTGKLIGLGVASLIPTLIWVSTGFTLLRVGGGTLNLPIEFSLPVGLLFGWLVFFLLGYALYASLMAGVGALAPNLKEANQAVGLIMLPMAIGYMLSILPPTIEVPHDGLALVLSLFPLTAPFAMVMRLVIGDVPAWQVLLSAGLLVLSIVIVVRGVASAFRAQSLLSGQPFTVKRFITTMFGGV